MKHKLYFYMKKWYNSKTMWLAILTFISGGLAVLGSEYDSLGYIVMVKAIVDMIIRLNTEKAIV